MIISTKVALKPYIEMLVSKISIYWYWKSSYHNSSYQYRKYWTSKPTKLKSHEFHMKPALTSIAIWSCFLGALTHVQVIFWPIALKQTYGYSCKYAEGTFIVCAQTIKGWVWTWTHYKILIRMEGTVCSVRTLKTVAPPGLKLVISWQEC